MEREHPGGVPGLFGELRQLLEGLPPIRPFHPVHIHHHHICWRGKGSPQAVKIVPRDGDDRPTEHYGPRHEDHGRENRLLFPRQALELCEVEGGDFGIREALTEHGRKLGGAPAYPINVRRMHTRLAMDAERDGPDGVYLGIVGIQRDRNPRPGRLARGPGRLHQFQEWVAHVRVLLLLDHAPAPSGCRVVDDAQVDLLYLGGHGQDLLRREY